MNSEQRQLTPDEHKCLAHLVEAWNTYRLLPEQHRSDLLEFMYAIHLAQNVVLARVGWRALQAGAEEGIGPKRLRLLL